MAKKIEKEKENNTVCIDDKHLRGVGTRPLSVLHSSPTSSRTRPVIRPLTPPSVNPCGTIVHTLALDTPLVENNNKALQINDIKEREK